MTVARRPAPRRIRALQHIHHGSERRIRRKRKPIAQRFEREIAVELIFQIVRHSRQSVALLDAVFVGNIFIASGKRNRLKSNRLNFINIFRRKSDDVADGIVVDRIDNRRYERNFDADRREIFNRF